MAKKIDFKTQTPAELATFVAAKRDAIRTLRFAASGSKNKNVKEGKMLRKDIARALTALNATKN